MTGRRAPLRERILRRSLVTDAGCWEWQGSIGADGYGRINAGAQGPYLLTHRALYEIERGPIPEGLVLDHLCRNRRCCNPDHLEPVTQRENCLRGEAPNLVLHREGRCANGHDLAIEASRRKGTGAVVYCRACRREARRAS